MYQAIGILTHLDQIKHKYWYIHMLSCMQFLKHCGSISYKMRLIFYQNSMDILGFQVFFSRQYQWFKWKIKWNKTFLELNYATSEVNFGGNQEHFKWSGDHNGSQIMTTHTQIPEWGYNTSVHSCIMVVLIFIILVLNTGWQTSWLNLRTKGVMNVVDLLNNSIFVRQNNLW